MTDRVEYDWLSIIKLNIFAFRAAGLWPSADGYKPNFYFLRSITIIFIFGFIQTASQTFKLLTNLTDMQVVAGTAFMVISCWLMLMKMFSIASNIQTLRKLLTILDDEMFQVRSNEQIENIAPSVKTWKLAYNLISGSIACSVIFWTVDSFRRRRLPFISWYPYNTTGSPLYEITCVHQLSSLSFAAYININMDTFIAVFSLYAAAQFDILCDNLKNLQPEVFREGLVVCVKHHRAIVNFVKSYNTTFDSIILVQFFTSAASLGITMFLVVGVPPLSSDFFSFLFYANGVIIEIFIYCWFGNELQIKSGNVFVVAFESHWTEASSEAKRDLIFFMLRTQKFLKISALNLFDLTLENFLRILKTAYSYFALVSRYDK
ncbi:hypothetical protein Zmor_020493 [Zophobas morio]|uniref:Odorant receptor n=1 Tax=Zophobas morio TaxID=2755281 RepID=A0AA38MA44_9CUCU|nr:hypothetical protein Zmor_020493 [Zophobas morio]